MNEVNRTKVQSEAHQMKGTRHFCIVVAFVLFMICLANAGERAGLKFSIYAVEQKSSPLKITGFKQVLEYPDELYLAVRNETDTAITDAVIAARMTEPATCSNGDSKTAEISGPSLERFTISPHQEITLVRSGPLSFGLLVKTAQIQNITAAHVQVEVVEVGFADGRRWRPTPDPRLSTGSPMRAFVPSLVETDSDLCTAPSSVLKLLSDIQGTRSQSGTKLLQSSTVSVDGNTIPHIVFECSLEGTTAICPKG